VCVRFIILWVDPKNGSKHTHTRNKPKQIAIQYGRRQQFDSSNHSLVCVIDFVGRVLDCVATTRRTNSCDTSAALYCCCNPTGGPRQGQCRGGGRSTDRKFLSGIATHLVLAGHLLYIIGHCGGDGGFPREGR